MKRFFLIILLFLGMFATAQRQLPQQDVPTLRERGSELKLTKEQKLRIMALIRRQRIQEYLNRKELESILTEEQKKKLREWRKNAPIKRKDSTAHSNVSPELLRKNE